MDTGGGTGRSQPACDPSSAPNGLDYICTASLIRSPFFFDDPLNGGVFNYQSTLFGMTLTVADTNHDGIDDLIVGAPIASHVDWALRFGAGQNPGPSLRTIFGSTANDPADKGVAFIYYGAKGVGVVAPDAGSMLGDNGMGLDGSALMLPRANAALFQIHPMPTAAPAQAPELDGITDVNRTFAMGMTTGDFNGDGYDDVAFASGNGQVYVYYGPLCQVDNTKTAIETAMYQNHNTACPTNTGAPGSCSSIGSGNAITSTACTLLNLNANFLPNTAANPVSYSPAASKPLYPQMIDVPGSSNSVLMGSTLLSKRPTRSPATTIVLKNPGNINGDAEGTSDLVVGTNFMTDPNLPAASTGLGYIYFGHKTPNAGEMSSLPGLFIEGTANYTGGIASQVLNGVTYYFYTPVLLKPHSSDGIVNGFFRFVTTMGDLNGDGTGDLIFPTQNIDFGADGTSSIIQGGGFKLFY